MPRVTVKVSERRSVWGRTKDEGVRPLQSEVIPYWLLLGGGMVGVDFRCFEVNQVLPS